MSFNRSGNIKFAVRRQSLRELVKAIQELENRGYECMAPYKKRYYQGKKFEESICQIAGGFYVKGKEFVECYESVVYEIYMKKVEK